jgi:hypothetical protein
MDSASGVTKKERCFPRSIAFKLPLHPRRGFGNFVTGVPAERHALSRVFLRGKGFMQSSKGDASMRKVALLLGAAALFAAPAANAQSDTAVGAGTGAAAGAIVGGPFGAAVGAGVGAIVGGISDANRPRFEEYVEHRHPRSFYYEGDVEVGVVLPRDRVTYYEVPREYGVTRYRYTVVNERTVLVDPRTGRVVQIID